MATDIQESLELLLAISDDEEFVPGDLKVDKVSNLFEAELVGYAEPSFGEDGTLFELEEAILAIP
jgi:hypothetical protein